MTIKVVLGHNRVVILATRLHLCFNEYPIS